MLCMSPETLRLLATEAEGTQTATKEFSGRAGLLCPDSAMSRIFGVIEIQLIVWLLKYVIFKLNII